MKLKPVPSVRRVSRDVPRADAQPAEEARPSDVRGVIDNATSDRLYGWAWDAAYPGRRLKVELRLAGEVVANTVADFVRPDLAKNGIGDGCHAFEFPLVPDWVERKGELTAVAFGADGTEVPIAMRIRRPEDGQVATQFHRAIEALLTEQQQIRADFTALSDRVAHLPDAATVEEIGGAQQELARKVEALELWLTRVDGRLGDAAQGRDRPAPGSIDVWEAVLLALLASATSAALAVATANYLIG